MESEWCETTLGEIVLFDAGHRDSQDAVDHGEYPFFTCSREILRHSEFDFDTEAVIMAGNNAQARFHLQYFNGRFAARQRTYIIRPATSAVDCRFLYYALHGLQPLFVAQAQGTTTKFVTIGILRSAPIHLPPLAEQRAIAQVLGALDDKIELNGQMNDTLEAIAGALFKTWFVDFDPVRAKAKGRDPSLPKVLADLFPTRVVDSELGEIPDGWALKLLSELLRESNERIGNLAAHEYSSTNMGLRLRSDRFTKKLARSNAKNKLIRKGYLVFGLSRRILNFGLMRDEIGSVSAAYKVFTIDSSAIDPDLLERMMRSRSNYFYNAVSASSREGQSVSSDALGHLKIVQPSAAAQCAYYHVTGALRARLDTLHAESDTLAFLRDTLLPKLISGELRAKDAERMVELTT